jgi:hypothetical protein
MVENNQLTPSVPIKNSNWAVIALISGIAGLTLVPFLGSLIAIIGGYAAKDDIHNSMGRLVGESMATWGLVLGWIGMALIIITLCLSIIIPLATGAALCGGLPDLMNGLGLYY